MILIISLVYPSAGNLITKNNISKCDEYSSLHDLLVGIWGREDTEKIVEYKYTKNGQYEEYIKYKENNQVWLFSATWKLNNKLITYVYKYIKIKGTNVNRAKNVVDTDIILSINCKELRIQSKSDDIYIYYKKGA